MLRKKTNYEKRGLVRQIAESIFSPKKDASLNRGNEGKWRPRKKLFERLDHGDEEEFDQESIRKTFSTESDTGEYRRDNLFERKKAAFKQVQKKRDLSSITIKPSARDKATSRTGTRPKKQRTDRKGFSDAFDSTPFNFNQARSDESVDDTMSRQTASSKQTSSTRHTAFDTVNSDPTEYFSKQPQKLTQRNLAMMAAASAEVAQTFSEDGIENVNPRSKFYQFTIDEDKESTVILPVGYPDKNYDSEEVCDDEETEHSLGFTSKGTMIQKRSPRRHENSQNKPMNSQPKDVFHGFLSGANKATDFISDEQTKQQTSTRDFFSEFESNNNRFEDSIPVTQGHFFASPKRETRRPTLSKHEQKKMQDPSPRRPSAQSLAYGASSSVQEVTREDNSWIPADQRRNRMPQTPPTNKKINEMCIRSQPRPARDRRLPLSPLNVMRPPNSDGKVSSLKKNTSGVHGSAMSENRQENRQHKPDPDAAWTQISTSRVEKKPDPGDFFSSSKEQVDPFDIRSTSHARSQDPADRFDTVGSSFNSSSKEVEPFGTVIPSFRSTMKQVELFEAGLASSNASRKKVDPFETSATVFEKPNKEVDPFDSNFESFNDPRNERHVHPFAATNASKQPAYLFDTQRMSFDDSSNQAECVENNSESNKEWGVDTFAPNVKPRKESEKIVGNDDGFNHRGAWGRKAIPEDDVVEDDDEEEGFAPPRGRWGQPQVERPMGIQSFPTPMGIQSFPTAARGASASSVNSRGNSVGSHSRSHDKSLLCSHGKPKSLCSHVEHADDESVSNASSAASYSKPLGLPNNAIMASMIFQRHHQVDTRVVEAKIKAKEEEYKIESNRGDIPQSVNAHDEMYSCVSSFSEDTAMTEAWRKPTRDLLENFARSRRTDGDFKKRIGEQRAKTAALFEA
jgi:hypothetical protein